MAGTVNGVQALQILLLNAPCNDATPHKFLAAAGI